MANLLEVIGAICDGAELAKTGGISIGRAALAGYYKRRNAEAQQILFDELRSGGLLPEQIAAQDDGIAVVHSYVRAAWEGRARVNLRLLAKAIRGQLQTGTLVADEFLLHAESLAGLSRDEIMLISTIYRHSRRQPDIPESELGQQEKQTPWLEALKELETAGWTKDKVSAVGGRALRSGLVIAQSAWDMLAYKASPMLIELSMTVDFDDALRKES